MKKNYKTVLKNWFFFLVLFFLLSCTVKSSKNIKYFPVESQIYKGKIWWKLEIFDKEEDKVWGGYASFETGTDHFYLLVRGFLGENIAFLKWESEIPQEISLYNFKKRKVYIWILKNFSELKDLPLYFLGFKDEKKVKVNSFVLSYVFFEEEQKGIIFSEQFKLEWQIKEVGLKESEKTLKEEIEKVSPWDVEISSYFLQVN